MNNMLASAEGDGYYSKAPRLPITSNQQTKAPVNLELLDMTILLYRLSSSVYMTVDDHPFRWIAVLGFVRIKCYMLMCYEFPLLSLIPVLHSTSTDILLISTSRTEGFVYQPESL